MEYIWYILAALGAGIGTGLAGLSAATVMVPILIVLCPSFSSRFHCIFPDSPLQGGGRLAINERASVYNETLSRCCLDNQECAGGWG